MARIPFRWRSFLAVAIVLAATWVVATREPDLSRVRVTSLADLERELEALRQRLGIPGMSAAIADRDRIVWARGFGLADVERGVAAGPDTIYPLASVTKPYASTVLLQLVEEGRLNLNAPVSDFGITMERTAPVRVWHLLSHTSGGEPGTTYRYDGYAFGRLDAVIERVTGRPFAGELADRIVRPLDLRHTAPYPGDIHGFRSLFVSLSSSAADLERGRAMFDASRLDRAPIAAALATGYAPAWGRAIWPSGLAGPMRPLTHGISASAAGGLVASAPDVARFSMALDQGRLLRPETLRRAWTPVVTPSGKTLPYGLGWFAQTDNGRPIVWHYGHFIESSALIVKLPSDKTTFVILANSDGLSRRRRLGDNGNVLASPAAVLFLNWVRRS
jgi:CubicO group peptidase (beta-lactamase class C family)